MISRNSGQRLVSAWTVASIGLPRNSGTTRTPAARDCFRTYSTSPDRRPGLTVTRMTPAMAAPNSTMIHSGMLWAQIATRSPGSKRARSAPAVRNACAYNSAYVHCRRWSRSGTPAISAIRSGVVSAAHCSSPPSVMSRTAGSFAPAAWEMVSMIVFSIEWARLDSVTNFNERRVPDVAEYRLRALQRGDNPRPAACADEEKGRGRRSGRLSAIGLWLLYPGGIEAGKVAIGFGIFRAAHSLTILNDGRTAARLPGGLRCRVGLLFFRRSRRSGANGTAAVDAEIGGLAGGKRFPGGDRRRLVCRRGRRRPRRFRRVCGVSMVHRK